MPAKFSVFYVEGYELRASTEGAAPLFQIARDAYQAACAADDIGQERLEEMVGACHWMLSALAAGNIAYPPFLDASDSDAEKLRDLVNQVVPGTDAYCWVELLPDGDELLPSQLLAAHTLHRLDVAATNLIEGSLSEALAALASASLGIADYSFLEGREDYRASERDTTTAHARASASATARMRALPAMKEYVRQRWFVPTSLP